MVDATRREQGITLVKQRVLTLEAPSAPDRPVHVSAASGLVCHGGRFYVVADDELHLGVFDEAGELPGRLVRLFGGELARDRTIRKTQKPDLEALVLLPPAQTWPCGALLALGSGSTINRCRAALLPFQADGALQEQPEIIDIEPFIDGLNRHFAQLNIEGATMHDQEMRLFQRANKSNPEGAAIRLPLQPFLAALNIGRVDKIDPLGIDPIDLGEVCGVPFSITDAAGLADGRTLVTAVAENTDDAYADGACLGALIALLDARMQPEKIWRLDQPWKVEGIHIRREENRRIHLCLVTDADDPDVASVLLSTTLEI